MHSSDKMVKTTILYTPYTLYLILYAIYTIYYHILPYTTIYLILYAIYTIYYHILPYTTIYVLCNIICSLLMLLHLKVLASCLWYFRATLLVFQLRMVEDRLKLLCAHHVLGLWEESLNWQSFLRAMISPALWAHVSVYYK